MEQRIERVEKRLDNLERQEREYAFTIRDIAHKLTINLGITTAQEADIKDMKADIAAIKATQSDHSEMFREQGQLLKEHDQMLNKQGQMLNEQSQMLNEQSQMLREILTRLS